MWNEENRTKIKRERKREMIPTTSTRSENGRTERTEGEDGRTLSAWRRFAGRVSRLGSFNSHLFIPLKNASFLTLFSFLSKEHVLAVFYQLFSMWPFPTWFSALFPFCPCVSPSETCFQAASLTMHVKAQTVKECVRVPRVLCAVAASNGDERSVCLIGPSTLFYWQCLDAIST